MSDIYTRANTENFSELQLLEEIKSLRNALESIKSAMGASYRIMLRPAQPKPFLGQPVTIIAKVTDALGAAPKANVPVIFTATWGRLLTADSSFQQGSTITARTNINGTVKVTIMPPTSENILEAQENALEHILKLIDNNAKTPQETKEGFQEMVRQYRWEANINFRRAVDIYFHEFRSQLADTINYSDYMQKWFYLNSTILSHVQEDRPEEEQSTPVQATAALTLRFKDWLRPWLQTYLEMFKSDNQLLKELKNIKEEGDDTGAVVDRFYGSIRDFVMSQQGIVGEFIGEKASENAIRNFLDTSKNDLSVQTQIALFPALQTASTTVATAGVKVLTGLARARTDLRQEMNTKIDQVKANKVDIGTFNTFTDNLSTFESQVKGFEGRLNNFQTTLDTFKPSLDNKVDIATFNALSKDVEGFEEQVMGFQTTLDTFQSSLANKVDIGTFNTFTDNLSTFESQVKGFEGRLNNFQTRLDTFKPALDNKVDIATFNALSKDVEGFEEQVMGFQTTLNTFKRSLDSKVDVKTFDVLSENMGVLKTRVEDIQKEIEGRASISAYNSLSEDVSVLQNQVGNVQRTLDNKVDIKDLNELSNSLKGQLTVFKDQIGELQLQVAEKVDRVEFNSELDKKVDSTTFKNFQTQIDESVSAKLDLATFNKFQTDTNNALQNKLEADTFNEFKTDVNTSLDSKVDVTKYNTFSSQVNSRFNTLNTSVNTLKISAIRPKE